MPEHTKITIAYLRNAAVGTRPEHRRRNECGLSRLHYLVPEYPRLPVMPYMFDLFKRYTGMIQAKLNRLVRKAAVVFFSREALFFNRSDQLPIFDQRRS